MSEIVKGVIDVLALNPTPTVKVQGAGAVQPPGVPLAVASPDRIAVGGKVESKPGGVVLVRAETPDVVAMPVPESGSRAGAKTGAALLYGAVGYAILGAIADVIAQEPDILRRIFPWAPEAVTGVLAVGLIWWRTSRQKRAATK